MRRGCWTSIITALVILVLVFSFVIVVSATSYDGKCEMGIGSYAYEACPFEQYFIKKFFLTSVVVTAVGLALLSRHVFYRSEVSWSGPERNSVTNYSNDPSKNKLHPKYLNTTKFSVLNTLPIYARLISVCIYFHTIAQVTSWLPRRENETMEMDQAEIPFAPLVYFNMPGFFQPGL